MGVWLYSDLKVYLYYDYMRGGNYVCYMIFYNYNMVWKIMIYIIINMVLMAFIIYK